MAVVKAGARVLGAVLLAATLSACGSGTREAPLDSYTAEELYKRGELRPISRKSNGFTPIPNGASGR